MKIENVILSRREFQKAAATSCVACGLLLSGASLPAGCVGGGSSPGLDRIRCMGTMLRMGHCAPTVMHTLIEEGRSDPDYTRLITLSAGLPGGIGNMGCECGGVTSSLMHLGLTPGMDEKSQNIPLLIHVGRKYMRAFQSMHGSIRCDEINTPESGKKACIEAVCSARGLVSGAKRDAGDALLSAELTKEYEILLDIFQDESFHCAHSVLSELSDLIDYDTIIGNATRGFIGGMALSGLTCGAFVAGVVAIGSAIGEIEDSVPRVLRMMWMMKNGENALADDVNKFNRPMNIGTKLGEWFSEQFGSTQCRDIIDADLSMPVGVQKYIREDGVPRCRKIAEKTAGKVRELIIDAQTSPVTPSLHESLPSEKTNNTSSGCF